MRLTLSKNGYKVKSKIQELEDITYEMPLLSPRERVEVADKMAQVTDNKDAGLSAMDNEVNSIISEYITILGLEVSEGEEVRVITSLRELYELHAGEEAIGILQKIRKEAIQVFSDYIKLGLETDDDVKT